MIVISYRREDTQWIAGRIFDRLEGHYGPGNVFMDIDNIPYGTDFREHLRQTLDRCDILIAVVGPNWSGLNDAGESRLHEEADWVRIEIATALEKKVPVIPLLVDGTRMPKPRDLPEDLRGFPFRQAARVDSGIDFRVHMERLTKSMDRLLAPKAVPTELHPRTTSEAGVDINASLPKEVHAPDKPADTTSSSVSKTEADAGQDIDAYGQAGELQNSPVASNTSARTPPLSSEQSSSIPESVPASAIEPAPASSLSVSPLLAGELPVPGLPGRVDGEASRGNNDELRKFGIIFAVIAVIALFAALAARH
jgi:hypothetical protein